MNYTTIKQRAVGTLQCKKISSPKQGYSQKNGNFFISTNRSNKQSLNDLHSSCCSRYVKDTFLKAIHNKEEETTTFYWLFPICQRYIFESNSQLDALFSDYLFVVPDMSKIHFWKQFTTLCALGCCDVELFPICQRYIFESNSQPFCLRLGKLVVVPDMSKIHFWKQFTTVVLVLVYTFVLFPICQRYIFESNSQPAKPRLTVIQGCSRYVKDTFLKAIHNCSDAIVYWNGVVPDMSKIHFWKQFTTSLHFWR